MRTRIAQNPRITSSLLIHQRGWMIGVIVFLFLLIVAIALL
jgi:hypothetical protein